MKHRHDDFQFRVIEYLGMVPGVSWKDVSQVDGFVDLIVGWKGINHLWEIKSEKGKLSKEQKLFHHCWSGKIVVIRSIEDINNALGIPNQK